MSPVRDRGVNVCQCVCGDQIEFIHPAPGRKTQNFHHDAHILKLAVTHPCILLPKYSIRVNIVATNPQPFFESFGLARSHEVAYMSAALRHNRDCHVVHFASSRAAPAAAADAADVKAKSSETVALF